MVRLQTQRCVALCIAQDAHPKKHENGRGQSLFPQQVAQWHARVLRGLRPAGQSLQMSALMDTRQSQTQSLLDRYWHRQKESCQ